MRMVSPSVSGAVVAHRHIADHDRPVGFEHFEHADAFVVIAGNLQQHIAGRPGREQDVVVFEQTRIVRNEIFGFGGLELEAPAQRPGAAPQIEQLQLGVVVEDDAVVERGLDLASWL